MKKIYFLAMLTCILTMNAQDDFESYNLTDISSQSTDWRTWSGTEGGLEDADVVDFYAASGLQSLFIDGSGSMDMIYFIDGAPTTGVHSVKWNMYIPAGKGGYFNMQAALTADGTGWSQALMGGNVYFNCGGSNAGMGKVTGAIDCSDNAEDSAFVYPEDEFFSIECIYDLDLQTWSMKINDVEQFTGHPLAFGTQVFEGLVGFDFFSVDANNEYYIDDIIVIHGTGASLNDLENLGFISYPNPVKDNLRMSANEEITSVKIYNIIGQEVKTLQPNALNYEINMSSLGSGAYFVKVAIGNTVGTIKIIK